MSKDAQLIDFAVTGDTYAASPSHSYIKRPAFQRPATWGWLAMIALSLAIQPGCRWQKLNVNEAMLVSYRDMVWAKRAYNLRYGNCDRPYGEHFYNGFCAGYEDVSNGGDGYVPALPPVGYRDNRFQSPDGAQCVNAWFEGYPAGVAAARQEKVGNYNNALVSKLIDTAVTREKNADRALPSDVPIKSSETPATDAPKLSTPPLPTGYSMDMMRKTMNSIYRNDVAMEESLDMTTPHSVVERQNSSTTPPVVTSSEMIREAKSNSGASISADETSRRLR